MFQKSSPCIPPCPVIGVPVRTNASYPPTMPRDARDMLDLGGSHGYYSVSLCRRHPDLRSVILDLPDAVEHAAPILAAEKMGDRVTHRPGNALTDDLGEGSVAIVFMSQLVHHFTDAQNRAAGLEPLEPIWLRTLPGGALVAGRKVG